MAAIKLWQRLNQPAMFYYYFIIFIYFSIISKMSINSFLNQTISLKIIVVFGGFWLIVAAFAIFYFFGGLKEGFQAGIVGLGSALDYKIGKGVKGSWENKDVQANAPVFIRPDSSLITQADTMTNTLAPATIPSEINDNANIYSNLEKNEGGPVPLPEEELLFFNRNKFSPECCPSAYSNGDGCVCASPEQMKYLNERGGNRTLHGEF